MTASPVKRGVSEPEVTNLIGRARSSLQRKASNHPSVSSNPVLEEENGEDHFTETRRLLKQNTTSLNRDARRSSHRGSQVPQLVSDENDGERRLSSNRSSIINLYSYLIGCTLLNLPAAIMQSGILVGIALCGMMTLLSLHSCSVVNKCIELTRIIKGDPKFEIEGYGDFAVDAPRFMKCVNFLVQLDFVFGATLCIAMMATTLDAASFSLFDTAKYSIYRYCVVGITAVLLPIVWIKHLNGLVLISLVATIANITVVGLVFVDSIVTISRDEKVGLQRPLAANTFSDLFESIGTLTYLFGLASIMPTFKADMATPKDLPKVTGIVHVLSLFTYGSVACIAIWAYGDQVQYPVSNGFTLTSLRTIVALGMIFSLLSSTALYLNPPGLEFEEWVGSIFPNSKEMFVRIVGRTFLLLFAAGCALITPRVDLFFNFIGAVSTNTCQTVLPMIFFFIMYRRLKRSDPQPEKMSIWFWGMCIFTCIWGLFSVVYGAYSGGGALFKAARDGS